MTLQEAAGKLRRFRGKVGTVRPFDDYIMLWGEGVGRAEQEALDQVLGAVCTSAIVLEDDLPVADLFRGALDREALAAHTVVTLGGLYDLLTEHGNDVRLMTQLSRALEMAKARLFDLQTKGIRSFNAQAKF